MPVIIVGVYLGIKAMIIAMIISSFIGLYINSYYTKKLINLSIWEQFKEISSSLFVGVIMGIVIFTIGWSLKDILNQFNILVIQVLIGIFATAYLSKVLKLSEYYEVRNILIEKNI